MDQGLFSLLNKTAIVVGGAGGIGRAVAHGLAAFGASVVVADIDAEQASKVADAIRRHESDRVAAVPVDVTKVPSITDMLESTLAQLGPVNILVNTVGRNVFSDMLELSSEDWDSILRLNLTGSFLVSREAARVMAREKSGGSIINFASVTALRGSPGQAAYASAKAAVVNLTKTMALEWIPYGIRVNAISPVMTETAINAGWLNAEPERKNAIIRRIPVGRLGQPDDFVGPVVFLASDASRFMIGQTLFVDGGASVTHPLFGG